MTLLKREYAFLYFLAHNPNEKQMKKILQYLVTPLQYMLLRELVINELARNLNSMDTDKKIKLRKKFKSKLLSLANSKYKKQKLHLLYPILKLLAFSVLSSFVH